jgi:hypothetical protein
MGPWYQNGSCLICVTECVPCSSFFPTFSFERSWPGRRETKHLYVQEGVLLACRTERFCLIILSDLR